MKLPRKAKAAKRMNARLRREKDPKRRAAKLAEIIDRAIDKAERARPKDGEAR